MDLNTILDNYLTDLVQENFGNDLTPEEIPDAKAELQSAFMQFFNSRLVDSFSDADLAEVEELIKSNRMNEVPGLAQAKGIDLAALVQSVMIEFRELYRGGNA
ncbi:MAG: hypothetical protein WBO49_04820 [Candidatus Saccharimonas sp.]